MDLGFILRVGLVWNKKSRYDKKHKGYEGIKNCDHSPQMNCKVNQIILR